MSDILTFICPQCGGQLQVTPYTRSVACPYCGTEQVVQQTTKPIQTSVPVMLCPVCQRNDRLEKIAIAADREHDSDAESARAKALAAPKLELCESILDRQISSKPELKTKPRLANALLLPIIFIGAAIYIEIALLLPKTDTPLCNMPFWLIVIVLLAVAFRQLDKKLPPALVPQEKLDADNKNALEKWQQGLASMEVVLESVRMQKKFWSELYYCGRDEIIYMPADGRYAPLTKIDGFVESYLPEKYKFVSLEELSDNFSKKFDS